TAAWSAKRGSCPTESLLSARMAALAGVPNERLTGAHTDEDYTFRANLCVSIVHANDGVSRSIEGGGMWMVSAEMCAAAVEARFCRGRNGPADENQILEMEPIYPGEVVAAVGASDTTCRDLARKILKNPMAARETLCASNDADIVPHHVGEFLAQRIEIARRLAEDAERAFARRFERIGIRIG